MFKQRDRIVRLFVLYPFIHVVRTGIQETSHHQFFRYRKCTHQFAILTPTLTHFRMKS